LLHYALFALQPAPTAVPLVMLYCLYSLQHLRLVALCCIPYYSLQQLRFIVLCCIPFTAFTICGWLHYVLFHLQPATNAFSCVMLYCLYSLQQLRFFALCSILLQTAPTAVYCIMLYSIGTYTKCDLLHYAVLTLQPATIAVYCNMLYSLQPAPNTFIALGFISLQPAQTSV